jgi:hypothetical protein
MPDLKCHDCGGHMKEGFLMDENHGGGTNVGSWLEGPPEKSIWTGVKKKGKAKYAIASYRCEKCGLLKLYAPSSKRS